MCKQNKQISVFCEVFGNTLRNQVLGDILTMYNFKFAVMDLKEHINISKPKIYQIIKELESEKIILKSIIVRGTQLYIINKKTKKVKLLKRTFNACINYEIDKEITELIQK